MTTTKTKNAVWIGTACCVAYAGCYTGRNILSAVMPQMTELKIFSESALGLMSSALLLCYGIGQLINGVLGNKINAKYMVSAGLAVTGLMIIIFPFCTSKTAGVLMWGACGFFCSMLWGPLSKIIGENTERSVGRILITLMTAASVIGTLLTYILALYGSAIGSYTAPFVISGITLIIIAAAYYIFSIHMEKCGVIGTYASENAQKIQTDFKKIFLNTGFISMVIVTLLYGVIRNAVSFWIPTFIAQNFSVSSKTAAAISTILPLTNILGTFVTMFIAKLLKYREKLMCMILFSFSVIMFVIVFLCKSGLAPLSISALFLASAAMTGACNMIFSIYVLHFTSTGLISGITGFFDFASYISASGASFLFPVILKAAGWSAVVAVWTAVTAAGTVFSLIAMKTDKAHLLD
jgi:sugar phosphate permease